MISKKERGDLGQLNSISEVKARRTGASAADNGLIMVLEEQGNS